MPANYLNTQSTDHWLNAPLAIVGMACRLPGADGLDEFWKLLSSGGYAVERMPDSKLNRARYFDPNKGKRGKTYADIGGFVAERELDWSLLNIAPSEAKQWDECHLNFCEIAARACQHAGYDPRNLPNKNAGVFVGHSGGSTLGGELAYRILVEDYVGLLRDLPSWRELGSEELEQRLHRLLTQSRPQRVDGKPWVDASFASAIVSRSMGLTGPHMSIDAACASSLVALALGGLSLYSGQIDMAIVGGASFNKTDSLVLFSNAQSCSASASRPFDERADGLVSSEGYVALVIKTLARAEADGDRIHAVLRGIGISTDGRGKSLWAPRKEGQIAAIERAYSDRVRPDAVQMIEAHATSTHLGDATEMQALADFYAPHLPIGRRLSVGSVKSNIGHTLETAGLAGVLKSVLAIQHGIIPPSIHVDQLNDSIPWSEIPLYVARRSEQWPELPVGVPRRAAVNAFGIGGLNVHVVVDEFLPMSHSHEESFAHGQARSPTPHVVKDLVKATGSAFEPIAIVGRGVVLPGALSIDAFQTLLGSRQLGEGQHFAGGGYVHDFHYDWRKHKVPPKQIAQANPLQFMLLEAAEQALREAGLLERDFDRKHTAVVVGSAFGGDFGNSLFAGLRLPEFRERLREVLREQCVAPETFARLADEYDAHFLKVYPALLDETGSFTSSTLASRLSKTFDLMGGAMAIDAGDTSSFAAIASACQLLHSGTVSHVLCAAAQRALDRAARENLRQLGCLPDTNTASDGSGLGEGVALVLLKPLTSAVRDGDQVFAVIEDCVADCSSLGKLPLESNLQAAQGMVDLIAASFSMRTANSRPSLLTARTLSGQSYEVRLVPPAPSSVSPQDHTPITSTLMGERTVPSPCETFCFSAETIQQFRSLIGGSDAISATAKQGLPSRDLWRATIVCPRVELPAKLQKLAVLVGNPASIHASFDQGLLWAAPAPEQEPQKKIAWIFPGQGSQYVGMMAELVHSDPVARRAMDEANAALAHIGQPGFEYMAWEPTHKLGEDIWQTQAAILVANWIAFKTLLGRGFVPDLVSGHSFGEFSAMLAAGCWDLPTALRATWHRCESISRNVQPGSAMISVQAEADWVRDLLAAEDWALTVSHRNASNQTVVGGKHAHIAQLAERLEEDGIVSRILPVPTAFHTPELLNACRPFRTALQDIEISPPKIPLLSSVNNRFVAEPQDIREGLVAQLVSPLDFVGLVQRLMEQGVSHVFEVGPQQVLTRLTRLICASHGPMFAMPTDSPRAGAASQMQVVQAALVLFDIPKRNTDDRSSIDPRPAHTSTVMAGAIVHFDATQTRKSRQRLESRSAAIVPAMAVREAHAAPQLLHFDATQTRRDGQRRQSAIAATPLNEHSQQKLPVAPAAIAHALQSPIEIEETKRPAIETFLIDFVVEQTGYPAEIIELDWDIEADLGIDSIKKAQLFGELREFFDIESHVGLKLDDYRSLRDIALLLERTPGKGDWLDQAVLAADPPVLPDPGNPDQELKPPRARTAPAENHPMERSFTNTNGAAASQHSARPLMDFLINFVVEQTGYPAEIVELDADLEADLGIDSIKKAQLFGELREMFSIEPQAGGRTGPDRLGLAEIRTLRQILAILESQQSSASTQASTAILAADAQDEPAKIVSHPRVQPTAPAPSNRIRSSVPTLDLSARFSNGDYCRATRDNLRCMVGRRDSSPLATVPSDDQMGIWHQKIGSTAELCGVSAQALQALDRLLIGKATFSPQLTSIHARSSGRLVGTANSDSIVWLASFHVPAWLNAGAESMGITALEASDHVGIGVAGTCWPLAVVRQSQLLIAGLVGVQGDAPTADVSVAQTESLRRLSAWLQAQPATKLEGLVQRAKQLQLSADWWLLAAHLDSTSVARVDSARGVVSTQWISIGELASARGPLPNGSAGGVGFDLQHNRFVVVGKQGVNFDSSAQRLEASVTTPQRQPEVMAVNSELRPEARATGQATIANRYVLRMVPSAQRPAPGRQPRWSGTALLVGDNPVARQLEARLRGAGVDTVRWPASDDPHKLAEQFAHLCGESGTRRTFPHLFLLTACDADAKFSLAAAAWKSRRNKGLLGNFWLCQKWMEHIISLDMTDDASLFAVSTLGGDFGISGDIQSAEGGGIGGLLKSILIESWMQGYRSLPIKTLDTAVHQSPAEIVDCLWRELTIPSYDNEISYAAGIRQVVRAVQQPLQRRNGKPHTITQGGTWICTGGARGITSFVAERLALRYGLTLHLLGTSPPPQSAAQQQPLDEPGLKRLKVEVMTVARAEGRNPIKAWQDTEKQFEIESTLRRMRAAGIDATYHGCNVADRLSLQHTLQKIRSVSGSIHGLLHGAGVGKDSRFDRKQEEKVEQCIAAKVDGALALMEATAQDPLDCFIGFGSISGRFGANGHTDYSLANDMLCKQIDWLRRARPEVNAIGFHWHAWGDVGMATKPETRLALEMIDMQFMPAEEGFEHLVGELESGAGDSEVLITDDRYYRSFYPAETLVGTGKQVANDRTMQTPLLTEVSTSAPLNIQVHVANVDPNRDPFLTEHLLDARPLLPLVIASEMLVEAGAKHLRSAHVSLHNIEAHSAIRFFSESPQALQVISKKHGSERVTCEMRSDFVGRSGQLVDPNRLNFSAEVYIHSETSPLHRSKPTRIEIPSDAHWRRAAYPPVDSKFYVGWALQRLKRYSLVEGGVVGQISAPALIELAGIRRDVRGWMIPCAAMDACLFAVGLLAWQQVAAGSALPARIKQLTLGRLPSPGEACEVHARLQSAEEGRATFDFSLYGVDAGIILDAAGYEVAWLTHHTSTTSALPALDERG